METLDKFDIAILHELQADGRLRTVAEALLRRWHGVLASAATGGLAGPADDFYKFPWARVWLGTSQ